MKKIIWDSSKLYTDDTIDDYINKQSSAIIERQVYKIRSIKRGGQYRVREHSEHR
jgi:hypothetical protein